MVSLNQIEKDRTRVRIITHSGSGETKRRLLDMGLSFGAIAEVLIAGKGNAPYLIAVDHSRLVLEKNLASEVFVEEINQEGHHRFHNRHGKNMGKRGRTRWSLRK